MGTQQHDLAVILGSRIPIVVVETHEEKRFIDMLLELVTTARGDLYRPLFSWTVTEGLRRLDVDLGAQLHNAEPAKVLRHIRSVENPGIYALLDFHPYLADPINVRLLKDIAVRSGDGARTVVLVSHELELPPELEKLSARFEMALPDDNERAMLVAKVVEDWNRDNPGHVAIDKKAFGLLVKNLAGLTRADTERLAREAVYRDGAITSSDLPGTMQAKYQILNRSGVLSFEYETAAFAEVGGLAQLKRWLEQRRVALARQLENLEPPKGLLLIGVQGCGKSLAAKAAAGIFGVPLLRLDFGTLYNKFHGETERRLRESLQQAELMSPCVLWIDELEKGLATGGGDSGVSRRVLGTFLTWMAEKQAAVFVVATANEIADLPPELVRKGRFDEIFFVDLPGDRVRAEILQIHMKRRDLDAKSFDLAKLVATSQGFSGAEIEQGLVAALYAAHACGEALGTAHVLAEFQRTRPLSVVMAERVAALRAWAEGRTVPAS
jgi:ATP-dependent 26S proteasome regulatory subunit